MQLVNHQLQLKTPHHWREDGLMQESGVFCWLQYTTSPLDATKSYTLSL